MTVFYIACFLAVLSLIGGILVILRAGNKAQNRVFFIVTIFSAIWSVVFASIELPSELSQVDVLNKLAYFFGMLLMLSGTAFTYYFPKRQPLKSFVIYAALILPIAFLSFSDQIAGTVSVVDGKYVFEYGPLIIIYVVGFVSGIFLIVRNSVRIRKTLKAQAKTQLDFIMFGYSISLLSGIVLSVVLPVLHPETTLDNLAPASLTFMIMFVSYAIIKHKLFDFRAVLARSFGYVVSTFILVSVYVLSASLLRRLLFPGQQLSSAQLLVNVAVTIVLVSSYSRIKAQFDKLTNKLFFRDLYDPQILLDQLNQALVTNVELEGLLTKSALIIQENLKVNFCTFYVRETAYFSDRVIGAHRKQPEFNDLDELQELAAKLDSKVFSTESEYNNLAEERLAEILKKNDIEVFARLVNTLEYEVKGIGYLFLGTKKSGRAFVESDMKILEIIANELVIAVENVLRFEEIEQFNVTLQKKIDDATKELQMSNQKLRALDEAKDEFVSMASHQLRTPLTSIKGYLSMVLEGDAGKINETQRDMLGQAFFSSQRMVYLISDLLNVSRLKTGKFIIEPKPVYLPDLVEDEVNQLQDGAKAKDLTLVFTKPKQFSTLNLDDMKIRQVVMNFTDNAIYYTPSGGKITVALKETPKSVEFTVTDSGIGVPKDQQPKLFTKFYRADNARKARPDGTGLGLFMAKKVIIAQGGSIIFASKVGKGSTFGFSFPKEKLLIPTEKE